MTKSQQTLRDSPVPYTAGLLGEKATSQDVMHEAARSIGQDSGKKEDQPVGVTEALFTVQGSNTIITNAQRELNYYSQLINAGLFSANSAEVTKGLIDSASAVAATATAALTLAVTALSATAGSIALIISAKREIERIRKKIERRAQRIQELIKILNGKGEYSDLSALEKWYEISEQFSLRKIRAAIKKSEAADELTSSFAGFNVATSAVAFTTPPLAALGLAVTLPIAFSVAVANYWGEAKRAAVISQLEACAQSLKDSERALLTLAKERAKTEVNEAEAQGASEEAAQDSFIAAWMACASQEGISFFDTQQLEKQYHTHLATLKSQASTPPKTPEEIQNAAVLTLLKSRLSIEKATEKENKVTNFLAEYTKKQLWLTKTNRAFLEEAKAKTVVAQKPEDIEEQRKNQFYAKWDQLDENTQRKICALEELTDEEKVWVLLNDGIFTALIFGSLYAIIIGTAFAFPPLAIILVVSLGIGWLMHVVATRTMERKRLAAMNKIRVALGLAAIQPKLDWIDKLTTFITHAWSSLWGKHASSQSAKMSGSGISKFLVGLSIVVSAVAFFTMPIISLPIAIGIGLGFGISIGISTWRLSKKEAERNRLVTIAQAQLDVPAPIRDTAVSVSQFAQAKIAACVVAHQKESKLTTPDLELDRLTRKTHELRLAEEQRSAQSKKITGLRAILSVKSKSSEVRLDKELQELDVLTQRVNKARTEKIQQIETVASLAATAEIHGRPGFFNRDTLRSPVASPPSVSSVKP